jgi:hypothetical protein
MAIDTTTLRSRRALLVGTVGGMAAFAAQALARPAPAEAAATSLAYTNNEDDKTVLKAQSVVQSGFPSSGDGIGVLGMSDSSYGVYGGSHSSVGVFAASDLNVGIYAGTGGTSGIASGVYGTSHSTAGVYGQSGASFVGAPAKTGVFGYAAQDSASLGVFGQSTDGTGVRGQSDTHAGVYGSSGSGAPAVGLKVGVYGWGPVTSGLVPSYGVIGKSASALGIGVLGSCDAGVGVSAASKTGFALYAGGRVQFKTSGLGTIAAGSPSAVVTPGVPIGDGTRILVTLHGDAGGATVLKRVSKNTTAGNFKVILTANSANPCAFSWFVIG